MGTGTKIGIILIMILVVVVIANLLDSEVQSGPTAEQQVTGKNSRFAPTIKQPRTRSTNPSATDQRRTVRPVQERRLAANGTTEAPGKGVTKPLAAPVVTAPVATAPVVTAPVGAGQLQPAVSKVGEAEVTQATGVIRSDSETASTTRIARAIVTRPTVKKPDSTPTLKTITVQTGDSFWSIAARHLGSGLRWSELLKWNPELSEKSTLQPGQKLKVLTKATATKPLAKAASSSNTVSAGFRSVRIREGDTLYDIAREHYGDGNRWPEIRDANPEVNPNRLPVGKKIRLPR